MVGTMQCRFVMMQMGTTARGSFTHVSKIPTGLRQNPYFWDSPLFNSTFYSIHPS